MTTREFLESKKMRVWNNKRIYISIDLICEYAEFKISKYKSGNISNATLKNESISNKNAQKLYDVIKESNLYFDLEKNSFIFNRRNGYDDIIQNVIKKIESSVFLLTITDETTIDETTTDEKNIVFLAVSKNDKSIFAVGKTEQETKENLKKYLNYVYSIDVPIDDSIENAVHNSMDDFDIVSGIVKCDENNSEYEFIYKNI